MLEILTVAHVRLGGREYKTSAPSGILAGDNETLPADFEIFSPAHGYLVISQKHWDPNIDPKILESYPHLRDPQKGTP